MVNQTLARRYAVAIVQLAREQGVVGHVSADLQALTKIIGGPGLIHDFFVSPVVDRPAKERLLLQVFESRLHQVTLHSLLLLVRKRRETLLAAIVAEYLALERAAHGVEPLAIASARPLDTAERSRLVARLEDLYGKKFDVAEIVDPSLIGGIRIMMGDRRIDATISGRLSALARELAQSA